MSMSHIQVSRPVYNLFVGTTLKTSDYGGLGRGQNLEPPTSCSLTGLTSQVGHSHISCEVAFAIAEERQTSRAAHAPNSSDSLALATLRSLIGLK